MGSLGGEETGGNDTLRVTPRSFFLPSSTRWNLVMLAVLARVIASVLLAPFSCAPVPAPAPAAFARFCVC